MHTGKLGKAHGARKYNLNPGSLLFLSLSSAYVKWRLSIVVGVHVRCGKRVQQHDITMTSGIKGPTNKDVDDMYNIYCIGLGIPLMYKLALLLLR